MKSRGRYGYLNLKRGGHKSPAVPETEHKVSLIQLPSGKYSLMCRRTDCRFRRKNVESLQAAEDLARGHIASMNK